jgi:hypothetical protein
VANARVEYHLAFHLPVGSLHQFACTTNKSVLLICSKYLCFAPFLTCPPHPSRLSQVPPLLDFLSSLLAIRRTIRCAESITKTRSYVANPTSPSRPVLGIVRPKALGIQDCDGFTEQAGSQPSCSANIRRRPETSCRPTSTPFVPTYCSFNLLFQLVFQHVAFNLQNVAIRPVGLPVTSHIPQTSFRFCVWMTRDIGT